MDVFLTFDVEVWCDGWSDLDRTFPDAFRRYVYGRSKHGEFALPKTLEILKSSGVRATFFVESLFAYRFGVEPLAEIVEMIQAADQDVQLHVHPEWADEARPRLIDGPEGKRPLLSQYSVDEQTLLIAKGKEMLMRAGGRAPCAFRAGSYGCNRDTFIALARNALRFDSSINPGRSWSAPDLPPNERCQRVCSLEGIIEYPITCYSQRAGRMRQAQVGSTSFAEFEHLLHMASNQGRSAFVIVSHNFEMMFPGSSEPDAVVVRRFSQLCELLARQRETFRPVTFDESGGTPETVEPQVLISPTWKVACRNMEQAWRRIHR